MSSAAYFRPKPGEPAEAAKARAYLHLALSLLDRGENQEAAEHLAKAREALQELTAAENEKGGDT